MKRIKLISLYPQHWEYQGNKEQKLNHKIGDIFVDFAEYDKDNKFTGISWNGNISEENFKKLLMPFLIKIGVENHE